MNDQAAKLRKRIEQLKAYRQAKTIAVISGKGGVGKSNFALNFSLTLSKNQHKVLLFDLDIGMGNVDILLGLTPKYSIVDMFDKQLSIDDVVEIAPNNLSYIAAGSGLNEIFSIDEAKFEYFLKQLNDLIHSYDYIVFDMGAGVTQQSIYFMLAADECIIVTTPEPTSLTDAYAMIKHVTHKNNQLPLFLLVNRAINQKNGQQTMQRLQQVVNKFLARDLAPLGILPDDHTVMKAVTSQTPFTLYDPHAHITRAMNQIVDQYITNTINVNKKVPFTFINKLKQFIKER
ncbi:MinD/ParA family protein [Aquibacillus sediminis]|uniref:MinD/ParA family protein n=1 Tax=Aquibacillus sediminis TaxID=2574734 RepID=UPI001108B8F0|nr:MinD/ParA family protein [Aquibacillus sediminis]